MAFLDVGLAHPAAQTGLADSQVLGDLGDRFLPQPGQLHRTAAELLRVRAAGIVIRTPSVETIIASTSVSGKAGTGQIRFTERLAKAGIQPSVGAVGSPYNNALAENIISLYTTELIKTGSPG